MQSLHFRDQGSTTLRLNVPEPDFHLRYISIKHQIIIFLNQIALQSP